MILIILLYAIGISIEIKEKRKKKKELEYQYMFYTNDRKQQSMKQLQRIYKLSKKQIKKEYLSQIF
jgi:hypothetical protein